MIYLFSGTPGSGKSLHLAKIIIDSKFGFYTIIGNFPVKYAKANYTYVDNLYLTPEYLIRYSREYFKKESFREGKIKLIIDESQILFNSRDWNVQDRNAWIKFFTQHRKYGYDVYLVAQFDRMLDRQIRSLIEYEYIHRKVSNFGIKGWLLSFWSLGKLFCCVKVWYPLKEKTGSEFFLCRKKYYKIYDTLKTFDNTSDSVLSPQGDSPGGALETDSS